MGVCGEQKEKQKPNKDPLTQEETAIFDCKKCRDNLKAYIKRLERSEKLQKDKAKEYLREKNRPKAKISLNKSKIFAAQIESANNNLSVIEEQILTIEQTKSQAEVFKVLQTGNSVLKELQKEVNIEKWENIRDDMDDIKAQQKEIGDFLKSHNINESEYEDSLNKDLEKLMEQEGIKLGSQSPSANQKVDLNKELPNAPDNNLTKNVGVERVQTEHETKEKEKKKEILVENI